MPIVGARRREWRLLTEARLEVRHLRDWPWRRLRPHLHRSRAVRFPLPQIALLVDLELPARTPLRFFPQLRRPEWQHTACGCRHGVGRGASRRGWPTRHGRLLHPPNSHTRIGIAHRHRASASASRTGIAHRHRARASRRWAGTARFGAERLDERCRAEQVVG